MIVFLLIITAAGLALAAHVIETIQFGIAAVVVSLGSVLLIAWRTWADRREREPATPEDADGDAGSEVPRTDDDEEPVSTGAVAVGRGDVGGDTVRVRPGRKRFHEPRCSSLAGRESEELTREEAEDEGFTPCSLCHPATSVIRRIG